MTIATMMPSRLLIMIVCTPLAGRIDAARMRHVCEAYV
jgi:hypothetical protein